MNVSPLLEIPAISAPDHHPGGGIAGKWDMTFVKHDRQSIRLSGHDYGRFDVYYITICAYQHKCLFGRIIDGKMILNTFGKIVESEWLKTPKIRPEIALDEYIIMPDHLHGILVIKFDMVRPRMGRRGVLQYAPTPTQYIPTGINPAPTLQSPSQNIGSIIRGFKSTVTKQINIIRKMPKFPVWQRNYYEHVVRNDNELERIRIYVIDNPISSKSHL